MVAKQPRSLLWEVALLVQGRAPLPYTFGGCLSLRLLSPWWRCDSDGMLLPHHFQQIRRGGTLALVSLRIMHSRLTSKSAIV